MNTDGASRAGRADPSEPTPPGAQPPRPDRLPRWIDSLPFRVAAMLSVALLPLGLIALAQTQRSIGAAEDAFEATLRAQTVRIATPEREAIVTAFGLARGLANTLVVLGPDETACNDLMERTRDSNPETSFVGFVAVGAISSCNSSRERFDFSGNPASERLFADPHPDVTFNPAGEVSRQSVIIVSQPVYDDDDSFLGFIAISLPSRPISVQRPELEFGGLGVFLTFNGRGEILTTEGSVDDILGQLPAEGTLADLTGGGAYTFQAQARDGSRRTFSVVPIVPDRAYALGSWARDAGMAGGGAVSAAPLAFPILMWLVSLAVALLAINRLVLRHVRALGLNMRTFAETRSFPPPDPRIETVPLEFREISRSFDQMARKIVRDEADLENALFERGVLFKEVHHRVKNNLQLMSSILNMQIRRTQSEDVGSALRGVQDRINSLATVHRGLYESPEEISQVRVDGLLRNLIDQLLVIGVAAEGDVEIDIALEPLVLVPDQAAPLALLTTEAVTNALKYMSRDAEGRCFLSVTLRSLPEDAEGAFELEIVNSIATPPAPASEPAITGVGKRLIDSFVMQLGGRAETIAENGSYRFTVSFVPAPFEPAET